ncbi:MAG: transporter associated domain-containing protein, partial [Phoenicibacter congonensis]|nr:transporter associated domain-containing protein [Phoenicibacter congonensis]
SILLDGKMPIGDLVELLGFEPEGASDVETTAGLVLKLLDRIPSVGDATSIKKELMDETVEAEFEVIKMDNLRVDTVLLVIDRLPK